MVVSDGLHQNAGCAEQPLVLGLKIDRKAGQLTDDEETTHSNDTLRTHEVHPFKDSGRRRVRRPRPVRCRLTAPGRPQMEVRVHYLSLPFLKLAVSLKFEFIGRRRLVRCNKWLDFQYSTQAGCKSCSERASFRTSAETSRYCLGLPEPR